MDIVDTEFLVDTESSSESSSSSTSSDSEFWISSGEEGPSTLQQALFHRKKKHRVLHFVRDVVHKYSHEEFRRNFRVNKDTATKLSEQFSTSRHFRRRKNCGGRREISPETQILAFFCAAMDRTGQQLRYSTGIINAVALKTDSNLSYCEMYRSKNTCLCMTVEDKERKFGALPECNGMCPKQNINIYIENYEARTNNEKYDLKCDSANLDSYPYYKPLKPESKMGAINNVYFNRNVSAKTRPIYREVPWEGHPNKTDQSRNYPPSNVTCYPYINNAHQYNIAEGSSCAKSQIKTNLAPAIENTQLYRESMEKNKIMLNSAPLPNSSPVVGSGSVASSSSCNNLYVAPPFFTVDKFATAEQVEARRNHPQSSQFCQTRQYPNNQRECSTIVYGNDASRDHPAPPPREHYYVKTNDMKLAESPDIPLMYVGASIEPIAVDIRNERCHYPIEKEAYNYKTKCIYNYQNEQMANGVEYIKAKGNPLPYQQDQYMANSSMALDKQNKHPEYSAPVHPKIPFHDAQYQQYQRNPSHANFPPNRYNVLPPPEKSVIRETRKPNYRELINHVHALRNSTSEDDLNRQIIQRTLNYGQPQKSAQVVSNSQMAPNAAPSPNQDYPLPRVQNRTIREQKPPTNPAFPLDLSVKTVKTKADSTENHSNCKFIVSKNGYLPKFNFMPDFSENRAIDTNGMIPNPAASHPNSSEVDIKIPIQHLRVENNLSPFAHRVKSELPHEPPMPKVRMIEQPTAGVVGNFTGPPTMLSPVVNQRTVIKQEVLLKRKSPFDIADETATCLPKKECLESPPVVVPMPVSSPKCPDVKSTFENFKHAFAAKYNIEQRAARENEQNVQTNLVITKKEITDKIEHKPDVSSIIAARIRTKAELKGFTFQETPEIHHPKPLSNKENFQCNYDTQSSVQMDEVDLTAWEHACSDFVNQLTNDCKSFHRERKRKNSVSKVSTVPLPVEGDDSLKVTAPEDNASSEEQLVVVKPEEVVIKTEIDPLPAEAESSLQDNELEIKCNDSTLTQKTDPKDNKLDEQSVQPGPAEESRSSTPVKEKEEPARDIVDRSPDRKQKTESCEKAKVAATEYQTGNKDSEQKQLKNSPKQMDLTKISVVRLKREKYPSKRYASSENIKFKAKTTETSDASKEEPSFSRQNKLGRCFPTLRRRNVSVEYTRRRQQSISKAKEICDSKYDTIKTRLRHKRLQTETLEGNKAKKKVRLHRHQKPNEREPSNESDKMYLEVYRYKRALKIPPNLITIRNMSTQRISTSLPDLDVDPRTSASSKKEQSPGCSSASKAKDVSKSIIDVLHSRVVKSKCPVKGSSSQKHSKQSEQTTPKVRVQQPCNSTELNIENLCGNSNDSTQREHRNVFETQVLTSRTRREYKMQLNKEVINEIFCGSERPASAPPEVKNFNMDNELSVEKTYKKCFDFTEKDVESAIDQDNNLKEFIMCLDIKKEKDAGEEEKNGEQKKDNSGSSKSVVPRKCKRFRNGRPYRRKFSSGFDYLRKRKKPTTPALYSYPHRKNKVQEEEEETNYKIKTEEDVLREIQKWVLNKGVGQSTLHKAARLGYLDVIVYCLEKMGLNPDHKDNAGYTPLHDACVNGSLEIARVLLQYGANHSEGAHSGIRPLHEASENGHIEIVRMLLSYGADPLLETYAGQTPLMLASDDEMNTFISMHLLDAQANGRSKNPWRFPGPWKIIDDTENGYDIFKEVSSFSSLESISSNDGKMSFEDKNDIVADDQCVVQKDTNDFVSNINAIKRFDSQIRSLKNDVCEFEILVDSADAEAELFEFEEANMPLPPLYLLKDEGVEKWVLLSDLCSLLKVKSKDTLLHKIFPSISPATVSRTLVRELKMCEFLEKATCLQLLCAGEKINICHSKVVLVRYNENVRKLLGVKTIFMKL